MIYIDKGENAGISADMAVMTADGIVGKVLLVYPSVAQVLLINDQSSGVGAILEKSRLQGVLRGTANGEVALERVMSDEQVQAGETVLTSGGDQIFPKGLPVGTVSQRRERQGSVSQYQDQDGSESEQARRSACAGRKAREAGDGRRQGSGPCERDILAQRLPSVPDRPTADASSVGVAGAARRGPGTTATRLAASTGWRESGRSRNRAARPFPRVPFRNLNRPASATAPRHEAVTPKNSAEPPKPASPSPTQPNSQPAS